MTIFNSHSPKNDHQGVHEESNFWISISDLLSGFVFIFILTLVTFSIHAKREQNEFVIAKKELKSSVITRNKILEDIKIELEKEHLEAEVLMREGIIRLGAAGIHFPASVAAPDTDSQNNIGKIARVLARVLPCYSHLVEENSLIASLPSWCGLDYNVTPYECNKKDYPVKIETIMIEGHTDPTPVKSTAPFSDNLTLSAMRAANVWNLMNQCNPLLSKLHNNIGKQIIGVSGYSYFRPIDPAKPADPKNRRIDIRFVMDLPDSMIEQDIAHGNTAVKVQKL